MSEPQPILNEQGEKLASWIDWPNGRKMIIYDGKIQNGLRFALSDEKEEDADFEVLKPKLLT